MAKKPDVDELCTELLKLRAKHADAYAREKEIKSLLLATAGERGENLKIVVPKLGVVKVSAPKDKRCTGTAPELVIESYLKLALREQIELVKGGMVHIAEQWTGAYYGAVTAELF